MRTILCALAGLIAPLALASAAFAAPAPVALFSEVSYRAAPEAAPLSGQFRNPVLPGFQPDPSIVRVGEDFYLVNSTFSWFPGIPVYHSRDLVNWRLVSHAIDRPGQLNLAGRDLTHQGVYAPTINHHGGKFYIINTCVGCGGNFLVSADRAEGPWSDPVWLDFGGIDPAIFVDDDGSAWITYNDMPEVPERYTGHRAIWIQRVDLASGKMSGPKKVLIDGGVNKADNPIWAEGPHLYKVNGWYYLMNAEGGTEAAHSETIWRSHKVDGPYEAGPVNPILTQRDMVPGRPDAVEATGHADLVQLADGSWWSVFLATRPYVGQSSLLGRETWLLPVRWENGWPIILDKGKPVPMQAKRPPLPAGPAMDWSRWRDRFTGPDLSPEWLRMRTATGNPWFSMGGPSGGLSLVAHAEPAGGLGQPSFLGRRLRSPTATYTTKLRFSPTREGDFAGLLAMITEEHFIAIGIEGGGGTSRNIVVRERRGKDQKETGERIASIPLAGIGKIGGEIELRMVFDHRQLNLAWRPVGARGWRTATGPDNLTGTVDVDHMASINAGLFTGVVVGPYAFTPSDN